MYVHLCAFSGLTQKLKTKNGRFVEIELHSDRNS
jgi:hypothetical protein